MENLNLILKDKIRRDPLSQEWINKFTDKHLTEVKIDKDYLLKDESFFAYSYITGYPFDLTQQMLCVSPFFLGCGLKLTVEISLKKHLEHLCGGNLSFDVGYSLAHEFAHPKYHFWGFLDEYSRREPGFWHSLIDQEAKRFADENEEFTISLGEKFLKQ